jgi:histidine ammonia-lyase
MSDTISLVPGRMSLGDLERVYRTGDVLSLDEAALAASVRAQKTVAAAAAGNAAVYGVNTGFGLLARERIAPDALKRLQSNLVLSHAVGTGPLIGEETTRLIMALKINSLARGFSGVRPVVIETLALCLQRDLLPAIPSKGSVGASGDLAPLAHLSAMLLGVGEARFRGELMPAEAALAKAGLAPLELEAKEGLALLNGTQTSTGFAIGALFETLRVFDSAILAGAMSVDAARGSDAPFDPRIHLVRGHQGQTDAAAALRALLAGSAIRASHADCDRVQDPYCLRCQPQVMGACLELIRHAARVLCVEANAVTDNPLVFPDEGEILSGGNFHAEPVAFAADQLALVLAEVGNLSERRMAMLVDPNHNGGLPAFLVRNGGENSGFMIAQVTTAALASENKGLAHPASVDSIPTSANQEDHVSMAAWAGRRLFDMADNAFGIVALELLAAAQGLDFHRPLQSSPRIEAAHAALRAEVAHWDKDRYFAPDMEKARRLLIEGRIGAGVDWLAA